MVICYGDRHRSPDGNQEGRHCRLQSSVRYKLSEQCAFQEEDDRLQANEVNIWRCIRFMAAALKEPRIDRRCDRFTGKVNILTNLHWNDEWLWTAGSWKMLFNDVMFRICNQLDESWKNLVRFSEQLLRSANIEKMTNSSLERNHAVIC